MTRKLDDVWEDKARLFRVLGVCLLVGSLFTVNIYGYLSILPSGMLATIGPTFIFNYSLQLSMFVAISSLFGWQFGDLAYLITGIFSSIAERASERSRAIRFLLHIGSLDVLGRAKHRMLRYFCGILSFCFLFSGFDILFTALMFFEVIIIWILITLYVQHRRENETPLPFRSWLIDLIDNIYDDIREVDWRDFEFVAIVPVTIFFSLLFSHEVGEGRANRILKSDPIYLAKPGSYAVPFATSSAGLILALADEETGIVSESVFILIGSSGEEILRSRQHK